MANVTTAKRLGNQNKFRQILAAGILTLVSTIGYSQEVDPNAFSNLTDEQKQAIDSSGFGQPQEQAPVIQGNAIEQNEFPTSGAATAAIPSGGTTSLTLPNADGTYPTIASDAADADCASAANSARTMCDASSGIDTVAQMFMRMAQMQQLSKSQDIHSMCTGAKKTSMLMGTLQATRAGLCKMKQMSCTAKCSAQTVSAESQPLLRKCQGYNDEFMMQIMQTLSYVGSYMQANNCAKATASDMIPTIPTNGAVDCTVTGNANHLTCVCAANARDPRCAYTNGTTVGSLFGNTGATGGAGIGRLDGSGDGVGAGDGGIAGEEIGATAAQKAAGTNGISGGGGGGPTGGGGSGGSADQVSSGAPAGSGFKTDVVSGAGGGSGGGAGGYRGGGPGGGGSGNSAADMAALKGMFNIKDALPDKNKLARGLAGVSEITGKQGECLFCKCTRQYRNQESTVGFVVQKGR